MDEKYGTYVAKSIVFLVRAVPEQTFGAVAPCAAICGLFSAKLGRFYPTLKYARTRANLGEIRVEKYLPYPYQNTP